MILAQLAKKIRRPAPEQLRALQDAALKSWDAIFFSLPVQITRHQFRHHKLMLLFWALLLAVASGWVGKGVGGHNLFLEPEYLGQVNFWSLLILGSALGAFLFAYSVSLFIHLGYRYPFIGQHRYPFYLLSFNNFLIPGLFLSIFFWRFISYNTQMAGGFTWEVAGRVLGLLTGIGMVFLVSASYFFARRGLIARFGSSLEAGLNNKNSQHRRRIILDRARESLRRSMRCDWYIGRNLHLRRVPENQDNLRVVVKNLNQHHGKLLLLNVLTFALIAALGLLEDNPYFQIPAGASLFLVFALGMMMAGATTFWFRKSVVLTLLVVASLVWMNHQLDWFNERNQAIGLDYDKEPAVYSQEQIAEVHSLAAYQEDKAQTLAILDNWKDRYQQKYGPATLPKAVLVTASGGGLRSALWTFRVMQQLDSLSRGRISDEMRMLSGASGGMFGLAYYRELAWRRQQGESLNLSDAQFSGNISRDLLNRLFFKSFVDIVLPSRRLESGGRFYDNERGFSFDRQLQQNIPELADRRIGDYAQAEGEALIPQLVLTPTVLNQGRKLFISATPVTYLAKPNPITARYTSKAGGIEFQRFFAEHDPGNLSLASALRMNATVPYIMPIVEMPSEPVMEIMDAGAIDNYGTQVAVRYLFEFREWFAKNTSGVIIIQVRDNDRVDPINPEPPNALARALHPLGGGYYSMAEAKDMSNDYLLEYIQEWYSGGVEVIPVVYPRDSGGDHVSLSWHLTEWEKSNIEKGLLTPANGKAFELFKAYYPEQMLAKRGL